MPVWAIAKYSDKGKCDAYCTVKFFPFFKTDLDAGEIFHDRGHEIMHHIDVADNYAEPKSSEISAKQKISCRVWFFVLQY